MIEIEQIFKKSLERISSNKINGEYTVLVNTINKNYNETCKLIESQTIASKIIRSESNGERTSIYFNVSIDRGFDLQNLIENMKKMDENSKIDFVESGVNW